MKEKTILFDFDGTVADTVGPIVEILNEIADDFGFPQIDGEILERFRNKENREALKYALEKGKIPKYKVPLIIKRVWSEIHKKIATWQPIDGMKEALLSLKRDGYQLGIVTTGSKRNVIKFLEGNEMEYFDFIYGGKSLFGKEKILQDLLKSHNLHPEEVFYIGDQTSDIEAARSVGIRSIAVTWGFNSEEILRKHNPDGFVTTPNDLEDVFKSL
ncbi:MAG: HAD-IA family hydrolase [Patescibacteria group bacterium]